MPRHLIWLLVLAVAWGCPGGAVAKPSGSTAAASATVAGIDNYDYDSRVASTTPAFNSRTDTFRGRPAQRTPVDVAPLVSGFFLAAKEAPAIVRGGETAATRYAARCIRPSTTAQVSARSSRWIAAGVPTRSTCARGRSSSSSRTTHGRSLRGTGSWMPRARARGDVSG